MNFWHNNASNPHDMRQHYRGDLPFFTAPFITESPAVYSMKNKDGRKDKKTRAVTRCADQRESKIKKDYISHRAPSRVECEV